MNTEGLPQNNPGEEGQPGGLIETDSAPAVGSPESQDLQPSVPETLTQPVEEKKQPWETSGSLSVRPYVDSTKENMGLEQYGFVLFPGTFHEEPIAAIERNGVVRYVTGLDEYAPEVRLIKDEDQRNAVIHNIRSVVCELEKQLASNSLDIEDEHFWNNVKLLKPDNHEFWDKITLRLGNEPTFLNPKEDPYELITLMAIEAGGFSLVAKSYEDAQARAQAPKFYLDKEMHTVATRTEYKKLRNKALGLLDDMYGKNPTKLLYVTKVVDAHSSQYKNSTPIDILYDNMDEFIQGNGVEGNKTRAAENFIKSAELDMETLKLKSIVKDAAFYKYIHTKGDGMIYHTAKTALLGRNVTDVVEFLRNPVNEDILNTVMLEVEKHWKE